MNSFQLEEIYKQIPKSTCPSGCGKCCGILYPSMAEIRNIKNWLARKHLPYLELTMNTSESCPYLAEDKSCKIYPVRPFLCRILGTCSDIPCPVKEIHPARILNHEQGAILYNAIYMHGKEKARRNAHMKILRPILREFIHPK